MANGNTGRALLIGLTQVSPLAYGGWDGRRGCEGAERDVMRMAALLDAKGYRVTTLVNDRATVAAIKTEIGNAGASAGDTFLLYFSGHAQQQRTLDPSETDHLDELLCAFDGRLSDDEIGRALAQLDGGVRLITIADACNSGTLLVEDPSAQGGPRKVKVMPQFNSHGLGAKQTAAAPTGPSDIIALAASRDGGQAVGFRAGSLFTLALCHVHAELPKDAPWRAYVEAVAGRMARQGQIMQLKVYGAAAGKRFETAPPFTA